MTFARAGKKWTAKVVQTDGNHVLPRSTPVFKGDSLAAVEAQVARCLDDLEVRFYYVTHDCEAILSEHQNRLVREALSAIGEAKSADVRSMRASYRAIRALSGFSLRDIAVLLNEEVPELERARDVGNQFGLMEP